MAHNQALQMLDELKEFATFSSATQRYIRRSLDVGLGRGGATQRWARDDRETSSIQAQTHLYSRLELLRTAVPDDFTPGAPETFLAELISISAFDLGEARLESFAAYRFLYERLVGAAVRPWLPSAFCAAAALPSLHPALRRTLLRSITEKAATAPGWSCREPVFFPEWVEKVEVPVTL